MKTIFQGYYGHRNSGDDAFIEVAAWGANKYWESDKQFFLIKDEFPTIMTHARFLNYSNDITSFLKSIKLILESDCFVSAGGSTFHSSVSFYNPKFYAGIKKKLGFHGQTGAIGVSLGPYKSTKDEKAVISYLKTLDFLALRDVFSYELATSYNLPYKPIDSFDLAALLPYMYKDEYVENMESHRTIGVSVCNYESYIKGGKMENEKRRNNFMLKLLDLVNSSNSSVKFRFFIFNGNETIGDSAITNYIISRLEEKSDFNYEVIPYLGNIELIWRKIKECNVMVSTRLHAGVFACFANVPFFLIEYHRKCTDFLDDIGQNIHYRLYDGEVDPESIVSHINYILNDGLHIPPLYVDECMNKALLNFTKTYEK